MAGMEECLADSYKSHHAQPRWLQHRARAAGRRAARPPALSRVTSCRASGVAMVVCREGNEVQDVVLLPSPLAPNPFWLRSHLFQACQVSALVCSSWPTLNVG